EPMSGDADNTDDHRGEANHTHRVELLLADHSREDGDEYRHRPNHHGTDIGRRGKLHSGRADQQEREARPGNEDHGARNSNLSKTEPLPDQHRSKNDAGDEITKKSDVEGAQMRGHPGARGDDPAGPTQDHKQTRTDAEI